MRLVIERRGRLLAKRFLRGSGLEIGATQT
jgi:hypothetical protein